MWLHDQADLSFDAWVHLQAILRIDVLSNPQPLAYSRTPAPVPRKRLTHQRIKTLSTLNPCMALAARSERFSVHLSLPIG